MLEQIPAEKHAEIRRSRPPSSADTIPKISILSWEWKSIGFIRTIIRENLVMEHRYDMVYEWREASVLPKQAVPIARTWVYFRQKPSSMHAAVRYLKICELGRGMLGSIDR